VASAFVSYACLFCHTSEQRIKASTASLFSLLPLGLGLPFSLLPSGLGLPLFSLLSLLLITMKGDYDRIASFYDRLSRLVFGKAIIASQRFLINAIPERAVVLIAGGGTGCILEEINHVHTSGLQITYIDSSAKMLALAEKRNTFENRVTFINQPLQEVSLQRVFDVVITPFFLDNFSDVTATQLFNRLDHSLKPGGLWLFADFYADRNSPIWQKLLLKLMYLLFRLFCNIEAKDLPHTEKMFGEHNYYFISSRFFYKNFIRSVVYKKG
jgi:ubiquinone/menaquinone biosynthesis C-methylase UbiE